MQQLHQSMLRSPVSAVTGLSLGCITKKICIEKQSLFNDLMVLTGSGVVKI
jgi:hypothetical protein